MFSSLYARSNLFSIPLLSRRFPKLVQIRSYWEYVNIMFNRPDPERIKLVGPDRACAEWVLRNGGSIVWADGRKLADYNFLPPESNRSAKVLEINGSDSSISHYGFGHLDGCTALKRVILHNNSYIDDRAMKGLEHGKQTLTHVQVSRCPNVTDFGLKSLDILQKLETLIIFDLENVKDIENCKKHLTSQLPKCKVEGGETLDDK